MHDRKKRLLWAVLAVMLPGPWTPVIVLAYIVGRATEHDEDTAPHDLPVSPYAPSDPYACVPAPPTRAPYASPR